MESECSSPRSPEPATCPYPEPDQFSPWVPTPPHFLKIHLLAQLQYTTIVSFTCTNMPHVETLCVDYKDQIMFKDLPQQKLNFKKCSNFYIWYSM
jgi:hypothetical protein